MPESEFSMDKYEVLFMQELRDVYSHGLPHFMPARILSGAVSYDLAVFNNYWKMNIMGTEIDSHVLRSLLAVQRRAILPNKYVSLFISFKTPFHVTSSRAKDPDVYDHWKEQGHKGYYRFELHENQNEFFGEIENLLGTLGTACYAAPAFSTFQECDISLASGTILQRSYFQKPTDLKNQDYLSYVDANAQGRIYPAESYREPFPVLKDIINAQNKLQVEPFLLHLAALWKVIIGHLGSSGEVYDNEFDLETARNSLGGQAELPVDPLGVIKTPGIDFPFFKSAKSAGVSLETLAAVIFAIRRIAREKMGADWLVFYN